MKRKFSVTGWALCTALGVTTLGGCGGGDSSTQVASNSTPAASTPSPSPSPSGPMAPSGPTAPSGPMGPPPEGGPDSSAPMSGPPAGYGPSGAMPGNPEGSSAGPGPYGQGIPMEGGSSSGEPMGVSSGISAPQGLDAGMANSSSGAYEGSSEGSSPVPGKGGAPYGGAGPMGLSGGPPNSGGPTGPSPADMAAQYSNANGGKPSAPGVGGPQTPGLPAFDSGSSGGIGAPVGSPNSFGSMGPGGQPTIEPTGPQKPAEDAPYLEKAKYAFSIGREPDAYKFALAHALSGAEDANTVLDEIQWVKDLMSPNSGVTFALGMDLKAPAGMTDYKPIGSTSDLGAPGPGGGRDMGMAGPGMMGIGGPMGGGGAPGRKDDPETFSKATGEMGRAFVRMFEERFAEGKFGKLFTDVENAAGSINSAPVPSGGMGGFDGGSGGASGLGMVGGPEGMMAPGGNGRGMVGPGGAGLGGVGPGVAKKTQSIGHRLTPGLAYIGTGSLGELKTKATKDGFDCLVFFDVQVEQNKRTGRVTNDTRVQVVSLKSGKVIASSKKLNNIEVQKRMEDGEGDGIDTALQVVFSKIDEQVILTTMPTLKPEVAQKRISDLVNSKQVPTLKALGEVCLFHHLKLINDEEKTSAYELLLEGADGNTLGTGSVEDKRPVLDKLMPKQ